MQGLSLLSLSQCKLGAAPWPSKEGHQFYSEPCRRAKTESCPSQCLARASGAQTPPSQGTQEPGVSQSLLRGWSEHWGPRAPCL